MITITGTLSKAWLHEALGVVFDRDYYFDPAKRHATDCRCNEYAVATFPGMGIFYSESNLGRIEYWDKGQVQIGGIQPNLLLGMLLGADFVPADDRDADITSCCVPPSQGGVQAPLAGATRKGWQRQTESSELADGFTPPPSARPAPSLRPCRCPSRSSSLQESLKPILPEPEMLLNHDLGKLFDRQIESVAKGSLCPIPPFFWDSSGRATIHGVLTTAQKLCGEAIFMDLLTEPTRALEFLNWIADAYIVLCRHFARAANLPITDVHVGECSCCMVGPAVVEEFIVPVTSRIAETLGPVRFHSCGTSTHLLPALAKIDRLASLDLGSGTSIRKARELFGSQMPITIAPAPQDMSAAGVQPILDWAGRVLEENASGTLGYVFHLEPGYNVETIYALTEFVRQQPDFQDMGGSNDG